MKDKIEKLIEKYQGIKDKADLETPKRIRGGKTELAYSSTAISTSMRTVISDLEELLKTEQ